MSLTPSSAPAPSHFPPAARPATRAGAGGPCVLLVDDDPGVLGTVARLLVQRGYRVVSARCGDEALGALATTSISAVISDLLEAAVAAPLAASGLLTLPKPFARTEILSLLEAMCPLEAPCPPGAVDRIVS